MTPNDELEQAYRQGYEQGKQSEHKRASNLIALAVMFISKHDVNNEAVTWVNRATKFLDGDD